MLIYKFICDVFSAEQAMKARKEIADYIKQKKTDRAKIRVRQRSPCDHGSCDKSYDIDIIDKSFCLFLIWCCYYKWPLTASNTIIVMLLL